MKPRERCRTSDYINYYLTIFFSSPFRRLVQKHSFVLSRILDMDVGPRVFKIAAKLYRMYPHLSSVSYCSRKTDWFSRLSRPDATGCSCWVFFLFFFSLLLFRRSRFSTRIVKLLSELGDYFNDAVQGWDVLEEEAWRIVWNVAKTDIRNSNQEKSRDLRFKKKKKRTGNALYESSSD